jgi:hypothetical protein
MAWLSGHSLSQTVFTCMYIHHVFSLVKESAAVSEKEDEPPELVFSVLKAYVLATIKCCHFVWREMVSGNVYEASAIGTINCSKLLADAINLSRRRILQPICLVSH